MPNPHYSQINVPYGPFGRMMMPNHCTCDSAGLGVTVPDEMTCRCTDDRTLHCAFGINRCCRNQGKGGHPRYRAELDAHCGSFP